MRLCTAFGKGAFWAAALSAALAGCSTNPATGEKQFAALMSPGQEQQIGAEEHRKAIATYGVPDNSENLQIYITQVGNRVAQDTERPDIRYKFFLLDDPMVNAFALPGGYVYITRGLLAQAGSEAELAAVLGHEIGHITARHAAERYSQGVVTSLGAAVLAAAIDNGTATQAIGIGSDLFLKSYSRGQESQADDLGLRYLSHAGYDPRGMTAFLRNLDSYTSLETRIGGGTGGGPAWFSTHPLTADRVQATSANAAKYPQQGATDRDRYLDMIDGIVYGDSPKQGFVRGTSFYHPQMDFTFSVPDGFTITNGAQQVSATDRAGSAVVFDAVTVPQGTDPLAYLTQQWMKDRPPADAARTEIAGHPAAEASFEGTVGGKPATIRIAAITWKPGTIVRFQTAVPQGTPPDAMRRTIAGLRPMTPAEKENVRPWRLRIVTAKAGDTVSTLARTMPFPDFGTERFRSLNGMAPNEEVAAGQRYKIVSAQ